MPLIGFTCPDSRPTAGQHNDFQFCINDCPHQCMPTAVLHTIAQRETENEHVGNMVSPSALSGCARKLVLERTTDFYEKPDKMYYATRGALVHGFLECRDLPRLSTEKRVYKTIPGCPAWPEPWTLSGRIDCYDHKLRKIEDVKTKADKGLFVIFNEGANEEYTWQLNIYRYLLDGGNLGAIDGPVIQWPVDELQLHFILMNRVVSTGRLHRETLNQKAAPNYGKRYKHEVKGTRVEGRTARGIPTWTFDVQLPPVEMKSLAEVEQYIQQQGPERLRAFSDASYMPAGIMNDKEASWLCDWCSVKERCDQIEAAATTAAATINNEVADSATETKEAA